jgi:hypothetical protein
VTRPALLPTLLGALVLLAGIVAFVRSSPPPLTPPPQVALEAVPASPFEATLVGVTATGEVHETALLQSYPEPGARLAESLRALREWLLAEGGWPEALGAPRVFLVTPTHAVLDFPLAALPTLSAEAEVQLIASLRRTAARQGVDEVTLLVNGRAPATFLGHVALADTLELPLEVAAQPEQTEE